jgi:membrane protein
LPGYRPVREIGSILRETLRGWSQAHGSILAAALSYYTIFSLAPLLLVAVSVAGLVFSEAAVTQQLVNEVNTVVSPEAAGALQSLLEYNLQARSSGVAAGIGVVGMLIGASLMFAQLKRAINILWGLAALPEKGLFVLMRTHFLSFVMVFVVILMLLGMMFANALLVSLNQRFAGLNMLLGGWWPDADFGLTFVGFALLIAVIFKTLPDACTAWRDVILGAAVTSLLFTVGGFLLGFYLGHVNLYNVYGAAGSIFLIMVWIYYSMQIILFGAKLTQVIANRYGSQIVPSRIAARIIHSLEVAEQESASLITGKSLK